MKYLFLDSNIYLHCRDFEQIDWKLLINDDVTIKLPLIVIREIDKQKDQSRGKIQTRAKKISSKLGEIILNDHTTKVAIEECEDPPSHYFDGNKFNKDVNDDWIILSAINMIDLNKIIGETTEYDKKQEVERHKLKSWMKSVCAFANGKGGILIFGISDNDDIIGLANVKDDAEFISQKIKERIDPVPQTLLKIEKVNNVDLLLLYVYSGTETPLLLYWRQCARNIHSYWERNRCRRCY